MSQQAPASSHDASNPAGRNTYKFKSIVDGAVEVCAHCHFDHPVNFDCVPAMLDGHLPRLDFEPTQPDIDYLTEEEWAHTMSTMEQETPAKIPRQKATSESTRGDVDAREENASLNGGGSADHNGFEYNQSQADVSPLRVTAYHSGHYAAPGSSNDNSGSYSGRDPWTFFTPPIHLNATESMSAAPRTASKPIPPAVELIASNLGPIPFEDASVQPKASQKAVPGLQDPALRPSVHGDSQSIDLTVGAPTASRDDTAVFSHEGVHKQHQATINGSQMPSAASMNQAGPAKIPDIPAPGKVITDHVKVSMRASPGLLQGLSKRADKQKTHSKPATAKACAKASAKASTTTVQTPSRTSPPTDTQPTSSTDGTTAPDVASDASNDFFKTIQDAEDWFQANREPLVKLNIPKDDYQSLQEVDIVEHAQRIESVLLDKHEPPKRDWNTKIQKYFEQNQANSLETLRQLRGTPAGIKNVRYHCIKAAQTIHDVHDKGVPKSHVDKDKDSKPTYGYYSDLRLTCEARFLKVESVINGNKSIAKRLAQGDFVHLVGNPQDCLQRELTNVYNNGRRELKKKEEMEAEEQARAAGTAAQARNDTAQQAGQAPKKTGAKSKKRTADDTDEPKPKRRRGNKATAEGEISLDQAKAASSSEQTAGDNVESAVPNPTVHSSYPMPDSMAPSGMMIAKPKQGAKRKQIPVTKDEAELK